MSAFYGIFTDLVSRSNIDKFFFLSFVFSYQSPLIKEHEDSQCLLQGGGQLRVSGKFSDWCIVQWRAWLSEYGRGGEAGRRRGLSRNFPSPLTTFSCFLQRHAIWIPSTFSRVLCHCVADILCRFKYFLFHSPLLLPSLSSPSTPPPIFSNSFHLCSDLCDKAEGGDCLLSPASLLPVHLPYLCKTYKVYFFQSSRKYDYRKLTRLNFRFSRQSRKIFSHFLYPRCNTIEKIIISKSNIRNYNKS